MNGKQIFLLLLEYSLDSVPSSLVAPGITRVTVVAPLINLIINKYAFFEMCKIVNINVTKWVS